MKFLVLTVKHLMLIYLDMVNMASLNILMVPPFADLVNKAGQNFSVRQVSEVQAKIVLDILNNFCKNLESMVSVKLFVEMEILIFLMASGIFAVSIVRLLIITAQIAIDGRHSTTVMMPTVEFQAILMKIWKSTSFCLKLLIVLAIMMMQWVGVETVRLSSAVDPKLTFYSVKLPPMLVLVVVVPVRLDAAMVNYG